MIYNYMETLVDQILLDEVQDNAHKYGGLCKCPSCLARIKTVALNNLPPFYVSSMAGKVFGEFESKEQKNRAEVLVAIGRGIEEVQRTGPHQGAPLVP